MLQVYLTRQYSRSRKRNGKRAFRWGLRWKERGRWKCEATGTADSVQAEALRKRKWDELNGLVLAPQEPEPEPVKASWQECRDALQRAMKADNLRPSYLLDTLLTFDTFRTMFPAASTPADVTPEMANEFKRRRAETKLSAWTIKGDLATLKAAFGKWLGSECGLLTSNPFAKVKPPKCDDPDVRIVTADESKSLFDWFAGRWNNWKLPAVYLDVAMLLGWRATEIASIREEDLLGDGYVRVVAASSKTRKHKYGWLPADVYADLKACAAKGWGFGRFTDELRRLLLLWRRCPHQAACVAEFTPKRLVGWMQDELKRFNDAKAAEAAEAKREWHSFTLHDFRRTAITGMQMAGVSEKEASVMVGATPEVIRKHYEKMDGMAIAKRSVERRLAVEFGHPNAPSLRARCAQSSKKPLDGASDFMQVLVG